MLIQLQHEENKEKGKNSSAKCLWIIWCLGISLLTIMAFARSFSLLSRMDYRHNLTTFPSQCGSWVNTGCSYVTMSNCTKADSIITSRNLTFSTPFAITVNQPIHTCTRSVKGAVLQAPHNLEKLNEFQDLIHVTFSSTILGFINDMYMQTYWNQTAGV